MGMFDSVYVQCACGREFEFQSKAGECTMRSFSLTDAPDAVKADLIGKSQECACGHVVLIVGGVAAHPQFTWNDE